MLVQRWASVAAVGLTLKQHWVNVSFGYYLVISLVADINAVNLYSIGYCRPTRDRPTHARFAVDWIFKHVLKKKVYLRKKIVCFWSGSKKLYFLVGRKTVIWLRRKTIPPWYQMVRPLWPKLNTEKVRKDTIDKCRCTLSFVALHLSLLWSIACVSSRMNQMPVRALTEPANTGYWINVGLLLAQRLRR